jgi:hypothetical protein
MAEVVRVLQIKIAAGKDLVKVSSAYTLKAFLPPTPLSNTLYD